MWLAILGLADKIFGVLGELLSFWIKRSDASKKERDAQQAAMDTAAKEGDFDKWKQARHKRNRA